MAMQRGGPPPPPPPGPVAKRGGPAPHKPAPAAAKKPAPAPKPSGGGMDSVLSQLQNRMGPPKESYAEVQQPRPAPKVASSPAPKPASSPAPKPVANPSQGARPGYKAPASDALPKGGGTLGTSMCYWSLSGPKVSQVQEEADFSLICRNENREFHDMDARLLEAEMWRPDNKDRTTVRGRISKEKLGHFRLIFRPQHTGEHVFNVWVKGELEKKQIYADGKEVPLTVIPGPTLTETEVIITAGGHGLNGGQVGRETTFNIWSKDTNERPHEIETSLIHVRLTAGMKRLNGHVERMGVGHYQASFTPHSSGEIEICILYGDDEVIKKNVLFTFGVDPSRTRILNCPSSVRVGQQATFVIQAKADTGADITYGGEKFDCSVSGPQKGVQGLVIRDETNGKYTTRFTLVIPGSYQFFVELSGVPLDGSPFTVTAN